LSQALFLESLNSIILAGLLTYFFFETPFPFLSEQWICVLFKDIGEAYSSGSVQDLHLIPFSVSSPKRERTPPKSGTKVNNKFYL
jgi:hypothetical protein